MIAMIAGHPQPQPPLPGQYSDIYRGKGEGEVRYRRGKYGGSEGEVHPAAA